MLAIDHDYLLRLHRENGDSLGLFRVTPDWEPAREWTRFLAVRQGRDPAALPGRAESILPVWDTRLGEPFLNGFRISVATAEGPAVRSRFPNRYFGDLARGISAALVRDGRLAEGDTFRYLSVAVPRKDEDADADPPRRPLFTAEEADPPLPIRETPIARFEDAAARAAGPPAGDGEIPLFVPDTVLREIRALSREKRDEETGGVLVGAIHRDRSRPEAFVEVVAQIPARDTVARKARLTFTPETWAGIRDARARRPADEVMVGWWHSHPVGAWCAECPPEKKESCRLQGGFFSEDDAGGGTSVSCFGWNRGAITSRGFAIIESRDAVAAGGLGADRPERGGKEERE